MMIAPLTFDQTGRPRHIFGSEGVADGSGQHPLLFIPLACPPMEDGNLIGQLRQQMGMQKIGKEVMIAKPVAPIIQRDDKEVAALQSRQGGAAFCLAGDSITERTTQTVKNRSLQEKVTQRFGLTLQDLFDQVIHNVAVVAGEGADEARHILMILHGEGGEL